MGKMNELSQAIDELRRCGDALIGVADSLRELFGGNNTEVEPQPTVEAAKPELTLEQVRAVLAEKSRGGYTAQVRELLVKHGAAKLSDIGPAEYPALMADAEELGNG
jgi:hypothetical protein